MLKAAGLATEQARLVVEKPLGNSGESSQKINDELATVFAEHQIYRIDHYLGKETVQNLMALRFANVIFESLWDNSHVDHVQITVAETVGVGGRASYYDQYGSATWCRTICCSLPVLSMGRRPSSTPIRSVMKLRVLRLRLEADALVLGQYEDYTDELGTSSYGNLCCDEAGD